MISRVGPASEQPPTQTGAWQGLSLLHLKGISHMALNSLLHNDSFFYKILGLFVSGVTAVSENGNIWS